MACSTTLLKLLGFLRNLNLSSEALGTPASPLKMGVASSNVVAHGFGMCGAFLRGADVRVHFSSAPGEGAVLIFVFSSGAGCAFFCSGCAAGANDLFFCCRGRGVFLVLFSAGAGLHWLSAARARALLLVRLRGACFFCCGRAAGVT